MLAEATTPVGTALQVQARTGDTAIPDAGWSAFTNIPWGGVALARYLQYQLVMTASGARSSSPAVRQVTVTFAVP